MAERRRCYEDTGSKETSGFSTSDFGFMSAGSFFVDLAEAYSFGFSDCFGFFGAFFAIFEACRRFSGAFDFFDFCACFDV